MDDLPELLADAVAGGTVIDIIDIGGGDTIAVTRSATHVFRSDGLLKDESVETFGHDVDRIGVKTKRRKSSIQLESIDASESFTVPSKIADAVVEATLEGVLRTTGVVAADEELQTQFRFSELTLVVTDRQLLKHVGSAVWDDEYEAFRYDELTGLDFEKGSVATQVIVETDSRRQRVKVPNEHAGSVQQVVQTAVFEYHGVSSLSGLQAKLDPETEPEPVGGDEAADADEAEATTSPEENGGQDDDDGFVSADWSPPADQDPARVTPNSDVDGNDAAAGAAESQPTADATTATPDAAADVEALSQQVEALAAKVDRQTELLEAQQETIEQLVDELRRGR
ncbi:uncharacterized protein NP_3354A [Natronomonas pharaonis DSM 2160]|uniref:DUF7115 domain-containing protein n=1 Tax=Natronomonas pharaonis (strain ATCC 35678 / DSM 2160 / CIP 103997 / JCM 8858 / NBRC 14720 / NCIMB 2260 / Gabara) TaxID=348780 RepID=A0A1U7EX83_NATPD|nr:hypothetical protein [Natronomonas pharaonis]CAI49768.1 uncharacterized protein NP_3354A [Natronomonas pharaonis DSM 2160]